MNTAQALYTFFSGFSIPAYDEQRVPDDAVMPYLTYQCIDSYLGDTNSITANLYYKTNSNIEPNAKAKAIADAIGSFKTLEIDDGYIWLKKGSPWCQTLADDATPDINRRLLNIDIEFLK